MCSRSQAEIGIWVSQRSLFPWTYQRTDHLTVGHLSRVRLFCAHINYVAHQVPLSMGFFQARILKCVAVSSSKGSSWPRDRTHISHIGRQGLYHWATREAPPLTESGNHSVVSNSLRPRGLYMSSWNSPGQNAGVSSLSLLQGIFPTQWLNPGLPHCRQILYQLIHKESPK